MKHLFAGGLAGFLGAFLVDLHSWAYSADPFNWKLAIKRWIAGAVAGASAGFGIASAGG